MARFSQERKEAVLSRLLPPYNMTVSDLAKVEGISEATLCNWRKQARLGGRAEPGPKPNNTDQWSAEAKLATVIETASMSEAQLNEHCRQKGLFVEQVKIWKEASLAGFQSADQQDKTLRQQSKADKQQIKSLRRSCAVKRKHRQKQRRCWYCEKSWMRSGRTTTRTTDRTARAPDYY